MGFFDCRGCRAKDGEIAHLMAQLDKLAAMVEKSQARVAELAEPGIAMRLAGADRAAIRPPAAARPARRMVQGFPGYGLEPKMGPNVELDEGPDS
jgi:hypothetical protein